METQNDSKNISLTHQTDQPPDERRLWIGNLDPRITEYQLLKLMQKHGTIEKFDLLFHRTGPLAGQPRGYAFVTFVNKQNAITAKANLHNKQLGNKNVIVTWAHSISTEEIEKPKPELNIPALGMAKSERKVNRQSQIQAIEAKLKLMERKSAVELEINKTVATEPPVMLSYQQNKQETSNNSNTCGNISKQRYSSKRHDRSNKPYSKQKFRR